MGYCPKSDSVERIGVDMSRRTHVSKDLIKQSVHYLEQYHQMMTIWGVNTLKTIKTEEEKEKFSAGIRKMFFEIQGNICSLRESIGDTPKTIEEAKAALDNTDYQTLINEVKARAIIYSLKNSFNPIYHIKKISFWMFCKLVAISEYIACVGGNYVSPERRKVPGNSSRAASAD